MTDPYEHTFRDTPLTPQIVEAIPEIIKRVDVDLYISQQIQQTEALASLAKSFEVIAKSLEHISKAIENRRGTIAVNIRGPNSL